MCSHTRSFKGVVVIECIKGVSCSFARLFLPWFERATPFIIIVKVLILAIEKLNVHISMNVTDLTTRVCELAMRKLTSARQPQIGAQIPTR